ncbi:class I SAM-dependent methyltransferase [Streptomyces sp. NPDC020799]|uniref:class I SAM-dependent methyltransferase n=1 Tax=Streptomyces sp. NPDC020799 TaxID=3365091 RepID=UPI00379F3BA6
MDTRPGPMDTGPSLHVFVGYATAAVLASLAMTGVLDLLHTEVTDDELPECPPHARRLRTACLDYLEQRGLLERTGPRIRLSERGRDIAKDKDYLVWLHGGYGSTFRALPNLLDGSQRYGRDHHRDGRVVAQASALIGRHAFVPPALELLRTISYDRVVDLGCGNARFLAKVCEQSGACGVGVDISPDACDEARSELRAAGMAERVEMVCGDAFALERVPHIKDTGLVTAFALLHEILGRGRPALIDFLSRLSALLPAGAHLLAMEVTPASSGAGSAGVNPEFTLVHALMSQTLYTEEEWSQALREAGFEITRIEHPPLAGSLLLLARNRGPLP